MGGGQLCSPEMFAVGWGKSSFLASHVDAFGGDGGGATELISWGVWEGANKDTVCHGMVAGSFVP